MNLERALELAERGRGTTHPNPVVGAVLVRDGEIVGEGWHRRRGEPHAEVIALEAAGDRARGATLYLTMEPCAHHGSTPPCTHAVIAAGVAKVVAGSLDPNPEVWVAKGRPFVILKLALTLDGRVGAPGQRWISGEESRRRVHELRAQVDAVAVGMGTVRADDPQLTVREVEVRRQPRRLAFGHGPLPEGSELELRSGPLEEELRALAADGVQSLLLEGGPTLAESFLRAELVDKVMLFVAPLVAGSGLTFTPDLDTPVELRRLTAEEVGDDLLLTGYVHEP